MKKNFVKILVILMTIFVVSPINTSALSIKETVNSNLYILEKETTTDDMDEWLNEYNQEQDCSGANSILGDPNDENSVAWLLQLVLNFIKIIGPILVVVLSSVDFLQIIVKSDDEAMGKARMKLIKRLIFAALLFFVPTLVQAMLDIFGITSDPTCGLQ